MKYKKSDNIRETLQQNMESIDTLNNMIPPISWSMEEQKGDSSRDLKGKYN